jgi:hypothetical protein
MEIRVQLPAEVAVADVHHRMKEFAMEAQVPVEES